MKKNGIDLKMFHCLKSYELETEYVFMMPTLSSLAALQVVVMTTCSATSDDKVGTMMTVFSD